MNASLSGRGRIDLFLVRLLGYEVHSRGDRVQPNTVKLAAGRWAVTHRAFARMVLGAILLAASVPVGAQDRTADDDVIFARKALKDTVCDRLADIEHMIATGHIDVDHARIEADAMAALLLAFPHLFPPSSNRWRPDGGNQDPETETLASPELWTDFADFYRQATASANAAFALSRARNAEEVKTQARALRITCDTCHALYLQEP
jgi:cytochrome c556